MKMQSAEIDTRSQATHLAMTQAILPHANITTTISRVKCPLTVSHGIINVALVGTAIKPLQAPVPNRFVVHPAAVVGNPIRPLQTPKPMHLPLSHGSIEMHAIHKMDFAFAVQSARKDKMAPGGSFSKGNSSPPRSITRT